jgi:tRNA(fMet)-specific endonuclease VapC
VKKVLLDTSAFVSYLRGDGRVLDWLAKAECVYMSVFVLGELYAGFKAGTKEKENRQIIERFLMKTTVSVLEASRETAEVFALIKNSLKKQGSPLPINDIWIAAHALETGSVLLTYDRHFTIISGLRLWDEI